MNDKLKECKHQYEAKTSKRQDIIKRYLTDGKYSINVLEQEVVTIFCVHCGDSKTIYSQEGILNEGRND